MPLVQPFRFQYNRSMKITGKKVVLRAVGAQDQQLLQSLVQDPKIVKITGGYPGAAVPMQPQAGFGPQPDPAGSLRCAIADREHAEEGLGILILSHVDPENRTAEIHIKLARTARGQGYGRDAVHALVSYGFQELGLQHICARILEYNTASRKLFEACGFRMEGTYRSRADRYGRCRTVCFYRITKEETTDI